MSGQLADRPDGQGPVHSATRRRQVERAAQEWRSALIDVSGSNRLLYFKPTAATLNLDDAVSAAVLELLAGYSVRLSRLFPDPTVRAAGVRACKNLAAKAREAAEEYGITVAYAAQGMATWSTDSSPGGADSSTEPATGGTRDGRARLGHPATPPAAPVLLRALDLAIRPGSVDGWELTLTGEAQLNPVLTHVLAAQGAILDEELILEAGDNSDRGAAAVYDQVIKACADVPGFAIDDRLLLGAFSYLKSPMVADCDDIDALLTSDLVAALAGDPDAVAATRTVVGDVREADPDYKPIASEFLILDADASQSFVVNAAVAGRNLVVQGPPGTGKSQTIANVIAALVAHGQRVLFVAQKRAAVTAVLDRLDAVGLGDLSLDLFAAGGSRRRVAEQIGVVLDRQATIGAPVTDPLHRALGAARDKLVGHAEAFHRRPHAWGITVAGLFALSASIPSTAASELRLAPAALKNWDPDDLEIHAEALGELAGHGGLDVDRSTRPGWSPAALTSGSRVAESTAALNEVRGQLLPAAWVALDAVTVDFSGSASTVPRPATTSGASVPGPSGQTTAMLSMLLDFLTEAAAAVTKIPGAFVTSGSDYQLVGDDYERLLGATDKTYRRDGQLKIGWADRRRARKTARALYSPADTSPADDRTLHELLVRAKAMRTTWIELGGSGPVRALAGLPVARTALGALRDGLVELAAFLQHTALDNLTLGDLETALASLSADRTRAHFPRVHDIETALAAAGLAPLVAALRRQANTPADGIHGDPSAAAEVLRHAVVHSVLDDALLTDPDLAGMNGRELETAADAFRRFDEAHLKANAARIRRLAAENLTRVLDDHPDQHLLVKREVTRRRNGMAVRRLFAEAPEVMGAAKPCWAMSPLQVSQLLPAEACFDVVIFDEASQVKPADAIPALIRAPRAIVAGDSRQLPPTEFFTKILEDPVDAPSNSRGASAAAADALADQAAREDVAIGLQDAFNEAATPEPARAVAAGKSYTRDAESILFAFDRILTGQSRRLLWHYRSRDERLIAVSNAWVYDGSLTTFPAADTNDCLRHEVVPGSPGIRGGANSPEAEVERVVDLVVEHARNRPEETLGVITFGVPHMRRIEVALEARFAGDPELEHALSGSPREPFFVKNIERVQGDERDAIILSVGYGKAADGQLRFFWGPLLTAGGERRLNVAISRARTRMTLVTSFAADEVGEDAHPSAGFALMWHFLRFMASSGTDLSNDGQRPVALNAFEIDIRDRLTAAGLDLVSQLGVGSYRLDFAARHPDAPGRYVLAIEADGAAYHSGHVARERDRLRQRLLEARGWTFHRIWSTDWFNDADTEVVRAVEAFRAALTAEAPADSSQPAAAGNEAGEPFELETKAAIGLEAGAADEVDWHIAAAGTRTELRPSFQPGLSIGKYQLATLVSLVRWVRSDGLLRTRDEELAVLMRELGFMKRGSLIVATLTAAQDRASGAPARLGPAPAPATISAWGESSRTSRSQFGNRPMSSQGAIRASEPQLRKLHAMLSARGSLRNRDDRLAFVSQLIGRPLRSTSDLSFDEASSVIDRLSRSKMD